MVDTSSCSLYSPSGETRLPLRKAQIVVATSLRTGGSNMPPAYCICDLRVSHSKDKSRESKCSFGFYGPSDAVKSELKPAASISAKVMVLVLSL